MSVDTSSMNNGATMDSTTVSSGATGTTASRTGSISTSNRDSARVR
ncbi:hypothetical protein [Epilithonimonas hominis]|nr:hypothetical protein [Epilithonimonas hominis]